MVSLNSKLIENNPVLKLAFQFSVDIIEFCSRLESQKRYVVAKQLLKAATSIGANISEAQNAESKADFIHKMKIAIKECSETNYWLLLCQKGYNLNETIGLLQQTDQLYRLLSKIITTTKKSLTKNT